MGTRTTWRYVTRPISSVTTRCAASRHDSNNTELVLTESHREAHGELARLDAGYTIVRTKHMRPIICEKGLIGHF